MNHGNPTFSPVSKKPDATATQGQAVELKAYEFRKPQFLEGKMTMLGMVLTGLSMLAGLFGFIIPDAEVKAMAQWASDNWESLGVFAGLVIAAYGKLRRNWRKEDALPILLLLCLPLTLMSCDAGAVPAPVVRVVEPLPGVPAVAAIGMPTIIIDLEEVPLDVLPPACLEDYQEKLLRIQGLNRKEQWGEDAVMAAARLK